MFDKLIPPYNWPFFPFEGMIGAMAGRSAGPSVLFGENAANAAENSVAQQCGGMAPADKTAEEQVKERRAYIGDEKLEAEKQAAENAANIELKEYALAATVLKERRVLDSKKWYELTPEQKLERLRAVILRQGADLDRILGRNQASGPKPIDPDAVYL